MNDDFERIVSFKHKTKVKLEGELNGAEVIFNFYAAPFLLLFLTQKSHKEQLRKPLAVNTHENCYFFVHREKLFFIPIDGHERKKVVLLAEDGHKIFNSPKAEIVGEINSRQLVFNKELPHNTFFSVGRGGSKYDPKYDDLFYPSVELKALLPEKEFLLQANTPVFIGMQGITPCFVYRNKVVEIEGIKYRNASPTIMVPDEDALLVKHFVLKQDHAFDKMKTQVEAFERFEKALKSKREPLPEEVKMYVWRRDEGKCVICSSQKNLEFDHIIPLSRGGSNTERNIQLLCETCNRQKSANI